MSEDTTKQPVVDGTPASATPEANVDSARNNGDDLDSLLAQFNEQAEPARTEPVSPQPPATQQQTGAPPQPDPLTLRLAQRIEREDIGKLVKEVKGDLDYDDELVEAWVHSQANKDKRLVKAWEEREANPQTFQTIAKGLAREFAKRASKRADPQVTEDRNAVAAAVRGASTHRAPESTPPNYAQQSNAEYRRSVREQYGFDPGV
jgi:hypothetical protein